jgi:hypothetical protein
VTDQVDLVQQVLEAVEELTEQGSVGFYASAIVAVTGGDPTEVTGLLLKMVDERTLEPRFEVRCPDNGRRIASYESIDDIPFGEDISSDRCDSADPFVLDETDVYVRFRLNQHSSSALRRRRHGEGGGDPGKAHQTRVHPGASPRFSLRPIRPLS